MSATTMTETAPSRGSTLVLGVLAVLGAAAFVHGITRGEASHAWATYLVNLLFWSSLAIVGPALAAMMQLTEARWSPSVKRVALSTGAFLPISFVLFLILLCLAIGFGAGWVFEKMRVRRKSEASGQ